MKANGVNILPREIVFTLARYDKDKDDKITFIDFIRELRKA